MEHRPKCWCYDVDDLLSSWAARPDSRTDTSSSTTVAQRSTKKERTTGRRKYVSSTVVVVVGEIAVGRDPRSWHQDTTRENADDSFGMIDRERCVGGRFGDL